MIFEVLLLILLVFCIIAIQVKDLVYAVISLGAASLTISVIFYLLQAPDIALTQAMIGAGLTTAIFIITINKTERYEK